MGPDVLRDVWQHDRRTESSSGGRAHEGGTPDEGNVRDDTTVARFRWISGSGPAISTGY